MMAALARQITIEQPDIDSQLATMVRTLEPVGFKKRRRGPRMAPAPRERHFALGKHVTIECYDCDEHVINSVGALEEACLKVVRSSGATIIKSFFQPFMPQGISGVIIISESHFSVHTWPEHCYAAADFFTCGSSIDIEKATETLKDVFHTPDVFISADMARGIVNNNGVERHVPVCEDSRHVYSLSWKERFEESKAWGIATSVDVYHCDPARIRDAEYIRKYVRELCERIDMRRFQDTVVVDFGEDERVSGFSMMQLIETSLVSGHFANQTDAAYIDIFSCKYYEPREAAEFTLQAFGGEHYQMQVALRS